MFLSYVVNHSCTLLYKFEVMGAYAGYESTFSLSLLSMVTLVECYHAIKCLVFCKNLYLKLRSPWTGNYNDIANIMFFSLSYQFELLIPGDYSILAHRTNIHW